VGTGQEQAITGELFKWGSITLNIILGLLVYIFRNTIKTLNTKIDKNEETTHESFVKIAEGQKEERKFWQQVFGDIDKKLEEHGKKINLNCKTTGELQQKINSELNRLDEKFESSKELCDTRHSEDRNKSHKRKKIIK